MMARHVCYRSAMTSRSLTILSAAVFSIAVSACGAGTTPPASTAADARQRLLIAQPCALPQANIQASYSRLFIQAAQVPSQDLRDPLGNWLTDHPVGAASVTSFTVAKGGATMSWNRCLDAACEGSEPWTVTVVPKLPMTATAPMLLTVQLQRQGNSDGPTHGATLKTHDQQPVVMDLGAAPETGEWSLVITPYLISGDDDMRHLAECKSRSSTPDAGADI